MNSKYAVRESGTAVPAGIECLVEGIFIYSNREF
jgi:hypothetical protein